jgi:hypothetical protein
LRENLVDRLLRFAIQWSNQATFPPKLRPHCSWLLRKVVDGAPDLDIWSAVAELLVAFDASQLSPGFKESNAIVTISSDVVGYLKKDWTSTFIGDSLTILQDVIRTFESQPPKDRDEFYARTLVFLQSSGMGKSRLADAFGQGCPMINYVLREERTMGFPPADNDILSFMRGHPSENQAGHFTLSPEKKHPTKRPDITWYHSLAVGLLQASFEILNTWVEERSKAGIGLNDLAALRHKEMAYDSESETPCNPQRIQFCKSVATRAEEIADDLIQKPTWRRVFDIVEGSGIRRELIDKKKKHLDDLLNAAKKLTENLGKLQPESMHDPPLVVVFDEASSLLKEPGDQRQQIRSGRYVALNRIMSCLKKYPIWFFIISTESQVGTIIPLNNAERIDDYAEDPSLRYVDNSGTQLKRIPPFLALRLNIEDMRRTQDPAQNELGKSLSDFGKPKHMAMFGRRLWYAYVDDPEQMNDLAKLKLIGGKQQGSYEPHNEHHVFAALSFRLSLDASLHNSKSIPLIRTAINSHMRVVISINQDTGTMDTIAPSEPILAKAAMEHLCDNELNWPVSINTLVRELLEKGLVEKGRKGELYARLVVILAHDWVRYRRGRQVSGKAGGELHQNANSDGGIHQRINSGGEIHQGSNPDFRPKFMKSFTVREFLEALYAEKGHESIMKIDSKILDARMNFTHFTLTQENLCDEVLEALFVFLLRRGAALQLAPAQPTYDILIPIYLGEEDEALELSKCSCIVIQVKNRVETTTPEAILREKFTLVNSRKRRASEIALTKAGIQKASEIASTKAKEKQASESPSTEASRRRSSRIALTKASEIASTKAKKEEASKSAPTKAKKKKGPKAKLVFGQVENPILFLLFDFGGARTGNSIAPSVEVSYNSNFANVPRVWVIHSRGHDESVFGCLSHMNCGEAGRKFFTSAVLGASKHDQATRENDVLRKLDVKLPAGKGTEKSETENEDDEDDEDTDEDMGEC